MDDNIERAKEFIRLARMVQGITMQQKRTALTQRNAEILDVKLEIEQIRKRILDCQLEREIEKNKKNDPAQRKKMTPEERDRKIREIFNLPTDPPPESEQGDAPVLHRSAQEIVAAARRSRRRRRQSDAPPPEQ